LFEEDLSCLVAITQNFPGLVHSAAAHYYSGQTTYESSCGFLVLLNEKHHNSALDDMLCNLHRSHRVLSCLR